MSDELDQKKSETEEPDVEAHHGPKKAANVEAGDEADRDDDFEGHMKKG